MIDRLEDIICSDLKYSKLNHNNVKKFFDTQYVIAENNTHTVGIKDYINFARSIQELHGLFAIINVISYYLVSEIL